MNIENKIHTFLHFGYVPSGSDIPEVSPDITPPEEFLSEMDFSELVELGKRKFQDSFHINDRENYIIPLSGGYDSRAILGEFLRREVPKKNYQTITFGIPGALDFDIAEKVAKYCKVDHRSFDLNNVEVNENEIIKAILDNGAWTGAFDVFYNRTILQGNDDGSKIVNGYMGNNITGDHLVQPVSSGSEEAIRRFINSEGGSRLNQSLNLQPDLEYLFKSEVPKPIGQLTIDEQVDINYRQRCYVKPILFSKRKNYVLPFLSRELIRFFVYLPQKYRINQVMYREVIHELYPELFSLPNKNRAGFSEDDSQIKVSALKFLNRLNRYAYNHYPKLKRKVTSSLNYIDFAGALRNRDDFKTLAADSLNNLVKRGLFKQQPISEMWNDHQKLNANYQSEITRLISLELNLKAEELK